MKTLARAFTAIWLCIAPTLVKGQVDTTKIKTDSTKVLKEVSVSGKKAFTVRKLDRVVVNVDALISNAGTSALEVLEKSPGIQVDQNGTISLKGKSNVTIFIDDKPTYLSGEDLQNYLKSLPSSSLEQIEIMTNPPARYDAAGNGGVINIRTKKGTTRGLNGGFTLAINQGKMTRSPNSFNLNLKDGKMNYFTNLSYNYNHSFSDLDINRRYKNADETTKSFFNQNSFFDRDGHSGNLKVGADYYQSKATTWGVVLSGMGRRSTQENNNTSKLLNPSSQLDSTITARNVDKIKFYNGGVNLNYRHQFDTTGHGITADADYLAFDNQTDQRYYNSSYFTNGDLKSQDILSGDLPSKINIYSLKTDYTLPMIKSWKLDAGLKMSFTKTDNTADYAYTVAEITKTDYDKSNHFIFKERISAAYLNFSKEMKHLSVQLGLRAEDTRSNGNQLGNLLKADSTFKRSYASLFPTFYLQYKIDSASNHQLGFNYGRRIDRPYYQDLNPFISPLDKFTFYVGNPFLRPAYVQSLELSYTFKNKYTLTSSYSNSKDEVNETIEITNGMYYSRPSNLGRQIVKSLSFNGTFDPLKWLSINVYSELTNVAVKSDFYTGPLNTAGTFSFSNANAKIILGKGWDAELSGNYRNRMYSAQFILGEIWSANTALQKKLSSSATLKLSFNDVFYTSIRTGTINNLAQTEANWINKSDSRNAVLSYSYRFGKAFSSASKRNDSGASEEKNRVKS
jgi:ferric enterobactin receptor